MLSLSFTKIYEKIKTIGQAGLTSALLENQCIVISEDPFYTPSQKNRCTGCSNGAVSHFPSGRAQITTHRNCRLQRLLLASRCPSSGGSQSLNPVIKRKKTSTRKVCVINGMFTALTPPQPSTCIETFVQELFSLLRGALFISVNISREEDTALRCPASAIKCNAKINKTSHG